MAKRRAHGEGTIFKRKNGRWAAQVFVTLANGNPKRAFVTAKTREEVVAKLHELREQENRGVPYADKDWTVGEYLDYWLSEIQPKRIRETTMALYSLASNNHLKPVLGNLKLKTLSTLNVRRALDELEKRGCSSAMRLECRKVLSACLGSAVREELIHRNVAGLVEKPKHTPQETLIWTAEQAAHFLQVSKDHPKYIVFLLLLTYGMRRGEALGLRWSDIDFRYGLIHIRQQIDRINGRVIARDLKTKNSRRALPLIPNVRVALLEHAEKNNVTLPPFDPYFRLSTEGTIAINSVGKRVEPKSLDWCFRNLTKKAGLPRIKVHAMRHTAATVLKELNVPVKDAQLILGHANISTTLNIYQHGTPETQRVAIAAIGERLLVTT
jgi:integrase